MDYIVSAGLRPPEAAELDQLQQQGAMWLLDHQLSQVEGVAGPDEEDIDVLDYRIDVNSGGATVMLALEAPTLPVAEQAAATVLGELLGESQAMANWSVTRSEVQITEDEFNQSLAAASGSSTSRLSEAEAALEAEVEEAFEGAVAQEFDEEPDSEHWRQRFENLASRLSSFTSEAFCCTDYEGTERGGLAAGALVHAMSVVTDELFYDELALSINDATVGEAVGLLVLEELPPCYRYGYDSRFARAMVLCSAVVATRLTEPAWRAPRSVAEALALRLFVNEARVCLEAAELMSWEESAARFEAFTAGAFAAGAFPNREYEDLFGIEFTLIGGSDEPVDVPEPQRREIEATLTERGLAFDQWFRRHDPEDPSTGIHPYLH